ncbi:AAA family ATPase [Marinoscillum sp. 108]|uniref:AAA family ATPase n=1 Tax=Marinoscillum sp. 108 TaxID=2653151 RepID=UPI0012F29088|nr:AAA family ATPase [Marinoscillum sp. 108]VXD12700.1 conserved hypothetical protein [Marinoscillum sp. 108]
MKLNSITVEKLFGVFDHHIPLHQEEGITIVIGENGLGKTVLLEIIESFFKRNYFYFNTITFDKIVFEFDDTISWHLQKTDDILNVTQVNKNKSEYNPLLLLDYGRRDWEQHASRITRYVPYLRRIGSRRWEDRRTRELLDFEDIISRYGDLVPYDPYVKEVEDFPKWFIERHNSINVTLIETQRLITLVEREDKRHEKTVEKYSNELSRTIKSYLAQSTELSSKLDRTYPNRLIDRLKQSSNATDEALNEELKKLEEKRALLDAVGLIEIEKDSGILKIEKPEDVVIDVLMLYVEDSFKKLEIFDKISSRIEVFLEILNKRFKHKKLHIDKESGFLLKSTIIKNKDGEFQDIPVTKLSSGEQNELVLFYELLFKTENSSLILIDEPEVSLHISWQNSFIKDLREIIKLNKLEVIIATHSPDIIANNWDLKVELKGLE